MFSRGKFFPWEIFPILPDGNFFPRDFFPTGKKSYGIFWNGFSCTNVMLLWSGQYYMYIVAFVHQLYTKYHIDGALQTEMRQQTAWER